MADIGAKSQPLVNSAMLASISEHSNTDSSNLSSGSKTPSHEAGESHHPFMQDHLIQAKLGQTLSSGTIGDFLKTEGFRLPGSEGVFDQQLSLGPHEIPLGHNLGGGLVGHGDIGAGNIGFAKQTHLPDLSSSLSTKGKEQGH